MPPPKVPDRAGGDGSKALFSEEKNQGTIPLIIQAAGEIRLGGQPPPDPGAHLDQPQTTLDHGGGKGLYLVLSRTVQAAQTPEIAKVFCCFSSEKKALPPSPRYTVQGILVRATTLPC